MISLPLPSRAQLEAGLTPDYVRSLGIIHAAIAMGPVFYFIVVLVIPGARESGDPLLTDAGLVQALTLATLVAFAVAVFVGKFLFQRILGSVLTADVHANEPGNTTTRLLSALKIGLIVRLVFLEGSAVLGLTVCLLGKISSVTVEDPLFWVNCMPMLYLCGYAVIQFPNRERLVGLIEEVR